MLSLLATVLEQRFERLKQQARRNKLVDLSIINEIEDQIKQLSCARRASIYTDCKENKLVKLNFIDASNKKLELQ